MVVQGPIVVYDGVMTFCNIMNQAYIPEESISIEELVSMFRDDLSSNKSPEYHPVPRKISRKESHTVAVTPYRPFYKHQSRSDGETDNEEQFTGSLSPSRRLSSSASASCLPNSILLPLRSDTLGEFEEEVLDSVFVDEKICDFRNRLIDQMNWMKTQGNDCVALETLSSITELVMLVRVFLKSKTPAALEFKVNHNATITVSYQFLNDFKNDFMMLKVHDKYCMFMSPF